MPLALRTCIACLAVAAAGALTHVAALGHGRHETGKPGGIARSEPSIASLFEIVSGARATARVQTDAAGEFRVIEADGLPDHATGRFPNRGNPHAIESQRYTLRMPLRPVRAAQPTPLGRASFGVALNGVLFDPETAEFWNDDPRSGWNYEALSGKVDLGLDRNNAHVQPNGAYHYHGLPAGLLERLARRGEPTLLGYAADGFPIYGPFGYREPQRAAGELVELRAGYRLRLGARAGGPGGTHDGTFVEDWEHAPGLGDLDFCNGREGVTPEYPQGTYHYVITSNFPFIPRCFAGAPDASFSRRALGGKPPPRKPPGGPPGHLGPPPPGKHGPPPPGKHGPPPPREKAPGG